MISNSLDNHRKINESPKVIIIPTDNEARIQSLAEKLKKTNDEIRWLEISNICMQEGPFKKPDTA